MSKDRQHPYVDKLKATYAGQQCDRREFLRTATLLGVSAGAAYGFAHSIDGLGALAQSEAVGPLPRGGTLRLGMRVREIATPHALEGWEACNIVTPVMDYLVRTGTDNVTRPHLLESWQPNEDLRTWTLRLRPDVTWRKGDRFVADHVIWNIEHILDPATGSSVLGLMQSYMLSEEDTGEVDAEGKPRMRTVLWDANAIEKVDDLTLRLNLKVSQLAVPEHLFHYPFFMMHPDSGGQFGIGADGTGAFELVEYELGARARFVARNNHWRDGLPYLDEITVVDLGDEGSALIAAMASDQVDGLFEIDDNQALALERFDHVVIHRAVTAQCGLARGHVTQPPFDDPRVRRALRLATDCQAVVDIALLGNGVVGEHHHVCPIHPEYAPLPPFPHDVEGARALLAEAGHPDGIDLVIAVKNQPAWELASVQVLVESWREAGIRCEINVMPAAAFWDVWTTVPFSFIGWGHRPLGVMVLALAYRTGVPWNESGWSNAEFDELLTQAESTPDIEARRAIMARLETIMQEDGPIVQPFWMGVTTAYNTRVKNFVLHPQKAIFPDELAVEAG